MSEQTFLADAMLGRLVKWLRLLGYDVTYAGDASDHEIAAQARAEARIVLTRDHGLARRKGIRSFLVDSQVLDEQLQEIVSAFGMPERGTGPRCPQCNGRLVEVDPSSVRPYVPAHVFETHRRFGYCPQCGKYYWPGSHWRGIREKIAQIFGSPGQER